LEDGLLENNWFICMLRLSSYCLYSLKSSYRIDVQVTSQ